MIVICSICKKKHVTDTARLLARVPGKTGIKEEWFKLPTIYTDTEICHPCFLKAYNAQTKLTAAV